MKTKPLTFFGRLKLYFQAYVYSGGGHSCISEKTIQRRLRDEFDKNLSIKEIKKEIRKMEADGLITTSDKKNGWTGPGVGFSRVPYRKVTRKGLKRIFSDQEKTTK